MPMIGDGYQIIAPKLTLELLVAIEDAAAAIARLDGRISASPVAGAWRMRAAWCGYARGLQLQGVEIDEIDVFSWGCRLPLPDRPRRTSNLDEFSDFGRWWETLLVGDSGQWRDQLPFTPVMAVELPILLRAIDLTRQYALRVGTVQPWLALPRFLHRLGLTDTPLPCLVGGAKALRNRQQPTPDVLRAILRSIATAARRGLERLDAIESTHRASVRAIVAEHRPGALIQLFVLGLSVPLLSPKSTAQALGLSLSGAGKMLERAEALGVLVEVSGRSAWKVYLTPDLAIAFGYRKPARGRPRAEPRLIPGDRRLGDAFDRFDREMELLDLRMNSARSSTVLG